MADTPNDQSKLIGDFVDPAENRPKAGDYYRELGASGLPHYGGIVQEEFLTELSGARWRKVVKQMSENDPVIGGILFAVEMMIRQVKWKVAPADESAEAEAAADFAHECLFDDMELTWPEMLGEILTMLPWGWSFLEMVFKPRQGVSDDPDRTSKFDDGKIGFARWPLRAQDSLFAWRFDQSGRPIAMEQLPAPDFQMRVIPLAKGLLFRTVSRKNNPEGRSILRNAYTSWYFKTNLERIEAIGIERDLAGLPVGLVPSEIIQAQSGTPQARAYQYWQKLITGIKNDEQHGVLIPSDCDERGNRLYDLKLLSTGGTRAFDTDKTITRYDQRMTASVLADFLLLGHTAKSGSYGMNESKIDLFYRALCAWLDSIASVINRVAFTKLMQLNAIPLELTPKLEHDEVESIDVLKFAEFVKTLTDANVIFTDEEIAYLKARAGLPVAADADQPQIREPQPPPPIGQSNGQPPAGQPTGETGDQPPPKARDAAKRDTAKTADQTAKARASAKAAAEPTTPPADEVVDVENWLQKMLPTEAVGLAKPTVDDGE